MELELVTELLQMFTNDGRRNFEIEDITQDDCTVIDRKLIKKKVILHKDIF